MQHPPELDELYVRASRLDGDDRERFLDEMCGRDTTLRRELDGLLAAGDEATSTGFLDPVMEGSARSTALPETIGPYRVVREVGRGAQAVVYQAVHSRTGEDVALKVLRNVLPDGASVLVRRFERESQALRGVSHPGLCEVLDTGVDDGTAWLAMRFVHGRPLSSFLAIRGADLPSNVVPARGGEGPPQGHAGGDERTERVLAFFERAALALHEAHRLGVLHRDIKPANLMVGDDGQAVLVDFGIASVKDGEGASQLTRTGDLLGTPSYVAPEQLEGPRRSELSTRSDVYSLGVSLYEALTGRRPFEAVSREALFRQILVEEPRPPSRLQDGVPSGADPVIAMALEKDPDRRYASAREFAADIGRLRHGEQTKARPVPPWRRGLRWARRNPALAVSLSATFLALAGVAWAAVGWARSTAEAHESRERALYAWYEPISREAAIADSRGTDIDQQWRLQQMALGVLEGEGSGFGTRLRELSARLPSSIDTAAYQRELCTALQAAHGNLRDLGLLCSADLAVAWARHSLFISSDEQPECDEIAIDLATLAVDQLSILPSADVRVVRARTVLVDAWLQAGQPEPAERALLHWLEHPSIRDNRLWQAIYETRLGAVYLQPGPLENVELARSHLEESVGLVEQQFPASWFTSGARTARIELADREGEDEATWALRLQCGYALIDGIGDRATQSSSARDWHVWTRPWRELYDTLVRKRGEIAADGISEPELSALLMEIEASLRELGALIDHPLANFVGHWAASVAIELGNRRGTVGHASEEVGRIYAFALRMIDQSPGEPETRAAVRWNMLIHLIAADEYERAHEVAELALTEAGPVQRRGIEGELGWCLLEEGEFAAALPLLRDNLDFRIARFGPGSPVARSGLWRMRRLYHYWDQAPRARTWYEDGAAVLGLHTNEVLTARFYLAQGQFTEARQLLSAAMKDQTTPRTRAALGELALAQGQWKEALDITDTESSEESASLSRVRARALLARDKPGDLEEALRIFEATQEEASQPWRFFLLTFDDWAAHGLALARASRQEEAVQLVQGLTDRCPNDFRAWHVRAFVLARGVGLDAYRRDAVESARKAMETPKGGELAYLRAGLAEALFRCGEPEEARTEMDRVLEAMDGRDRTWLTHAAAVAQRDRYR